MNRRDEIELLRGRHEIFDGLSGKEMMLVSADPPGRTDTESYIAVPIEHPEAGVIHIHEWQHVIFKTKLHARDRFVGSYVEHIARQRERLDKRSVCDFVTLVANALDDLRVNSLWSVVWPGDAARVAARWQKLVAQSDPGSFVMHLMGMGLGLTRLSPWRPYDELLREAAYRVYRHGYASVLTTTRWLLDQMLEVLPVEEMEEEETPSVSSPMSPTRRLTRRRQPENVERVEHGGRLLQRMLFQATKARNMLLDTHLPVSPDLDPEATGKLVQAAMGRVAADELDVLLNESRRDMNTIVATLRARTKPEDPQKALTRDLGTVHMRALDRHDVEELVLSPEDELLVDTLRSRFMQLMNLRGRKRSDSGGTLDPQRYMDLMLGSGESEIFLDERKTRGFSALLLSDMSGSMFSRWHTVSRACKVCAKSLSFPFSKLEVWGFSGTKEGETVMYHFLESERGYFPTTHQPEAWGLTPLHVAIPVAVRRLRQMPGSVQHLFLVSDGDPQHMGATSSAALRESVARGVNEALRLGINVVVILIGNTLPDAAANRMFGSRWVRISDNQEDFFHDLVRHVEKAFTSYLRR